MKKFLWFAGFVATTGIAVAGINYVQCQLPLHHVASADPRNEGISALAHFKYGVVSSTLVFDLREHSPENSMADVFRVLLQYAQAMQVSKFDRVELAYRGETRFLLNGEYFAQLGAELGQQNPV